MGTDLFAVLGTDPEDPRVGAAVQDARAAERLIDTLVEMRRHQAITQVQMAERMETTQSAVSKFERAGGDPRLSTIQRYARAIGARFHGTVSMSAADGDVWQQISYHVPALIDDEAGDLEEAVEPAHVRLVS